jgi:hypothetical protein
MILDDLLRSQGALGGCGYFLTCRVSAGDVDVNKSVFPLYVIWSPEIHGTSDRTLIVPDRAREPGAGYASKRTMGPSSACGSFLVPFGQYAAMAS